MLGVGLLARMWSGRRPTMLSMTEAYARWAPSYPPRAHNAVMMAEETVLRHMVQALAPRRALDVGTGTGRNLEILRQAGAGRLVGVDLSAAMLACGSDPSPRVRGDATALPFRSRSFDLVTSSLMCGDLPDLGRWVGEAARVLADGGSLVYSDFHPSWADARWRRTFAAGGRSYELPLHHHTIDEHLTLLDACGLQVRTIREPRVGERRTPVVVVFHAVRERSALR
jgi:malonyl-CoA O-methyltransferase